MDRTKKHMVVSFCLLLSFAALCSSAVSRSRAQDVKPADYSKEPFVLEQAFTKIVFENDGTYSVETTARARIQSQAGMQQFGVLNFPYASATSTMDVVYVRVIKPDKRVVETPAENIQDMPTDITRQAPFYSDLKEKQVAVKGLEIGDTIEFQNRNAVKSPLDPGQFWFAFNFFQAGICLQEELQISFPRDRNVKVQSTKVQPITTEQGAYWVYTWKTVNLESNAAKKDSKSTESEPVYPSVQITSFRDWDDVGQWVRSLVTPRTVPTPQIQAKADELTRTAKTDSEKIQAIYNFVSTKFRYIGIALGIGRYQPHVAADVLNNGYGDCKDKHTLMAALLAAEKIKAYPALISSTGKIDSEMAYPGQFDHMITAVPQGNGFLFLDTTPEVAPFGFLIDALRDKEALVIPDNGPATLIKTPEDPPFKSFFNFQADGALNDTGTLESKMQMSFRGDAELIYRLAFRQAGQPGWTDVMQKISSNLGFGGTVSDVTATPPDATDAPFRVEYTYNRKEYADWKNRQIISPFPPIFLPGVLDDGDKKAKRIRLGSPGEMLYQGTMKLPVNSDPHVPATVELHENFADYHSSYAFSNGVMHFERRLITRTHEIAPSQIEAYRNFVKAIIDDETSYIPLHDEKLVSDEVAGSPEARAFLARGAEAWQQRNMPAAAESYQRAVDKDPKFAEAWFWLGAAHVSMGYGDQGIQEMRKALALDPTQVSNDKYFASILMGMHRQDDALDEWKKLEKAYPDDADAPRYIAAILIQKGRYLEAAPELESAVDRDPDNSQLLLQLGQVYLKTGEKEKAIATIQKAADTQPTPLILNDAAYSLAENNLQLNDALRYAEKAVDREEFMTAGISLDDLDFKDIQSVPSLGAYWDTLGWVHFRMGHLEEAERYLNAAWNLTQNPVIADHLGQVYEKQLKKHAAAQLYAWAIAAGHAPEETAGRLKALRGGKLQSGESADGAELAQLRTVKLGRLASQHASAEFFLLFAPGPKIVGVKFISGSEALRNAGKALSAAKFEIPFPDNGAVQLLRRGVLDCEPELPGCLFVLIPPNSVHSLN